MEGTFRLVLFVVFVVFFVLIGLACLGVLLGWFKNRDPRLAKWAIPGFFGSLVAAVVGLFRASFLTAAPMILVTLAPQGDATPSLQSGTFEYDAIADGKVTTRMGAVDVAFGDGGWEAHLPGDLGDGSVILHFNDKDGQTWETPRFFAHRISKGITRQAAARVPVASGTSQSWAPPGIAVLMAAEPAGAEVQTGIKFNNYSRRIADQYSRATWQWRLFVDAPPSVLRTISKVDYVLHPTFPEPFQTSTDRDHQFEVNGSGWGSFNVLITVRYTDGRQEKVSYFLDLNKSWPNAPLQVSLDKIHVDWDGAAGTTNWSFDVLANSQPLVSLPAARYDDGGVGRHGKDYLAATNRWPVGKLTLAGGSTARIEIRGRRRDATGVATGIATLTASGGPLTVNVINPSDPKKGSFVFYFSAKN